MAQDEHPRKRMLIARKSLKGPPAAPNPQTETKEFDG
jgi:hypothetical protein